MVISATIALSDFIANTRELPSAVIERAKIHIGDTLACIYAGTVSRPVEVLIAASAPAGDGDGVLIPGLGRWTDPSLAALLTGTCAHADDFDDTSEFSMNGHPSAPIVSALLPTAFLLRSSGQAFLLAYAIGVEIACKLGVAVGTAHTHRGWHTMSTLGALAAAGAVANLRGLTAAQTERALAITCSFAGGILGNTGTMTKSLHCGRAANAGFLAAILAEKGLTAGSNILEAPAGFLEAFASRPAGTLALPPLGEPWELVTTGLAVKLYPCCSCTHLAIDGALELRRTPGFNIRAIERIDCFAREECIHYLRFEKPRTAIEAKFSMNYTVAAALLQGELTLDDFESAAIERGDIAALSDKVEMHVREEGSAQPDIAVSFSDGTRLGQRRDAPRGAPQDPPGWDDIAKKLSGGFARAKDRFLPADFERHVAALQQLEDVPRLSDIFA
ncbi:MmgE/PrpD family protein [Rhizobium sp. SYY.PMSO]|uniref:MmgE/PrpD family protein n=1 Tax=Rhizobium sp. SYY.PMSO TaxID=3382192 RepID=UPI0039901E27